MTNKIIEIGQKVIFDPFEGITFSKVGILNTEDRERREVVGTVIYINEDHRYFVAQYEDGGCNIRRGFKFNDIGGCVRICEEATE